MRLAVLIFAEPAIIPKKLSDQEYWTPWYPILPNKSQLQPPKNPTGKERKHFKSRLTTRTDVRDVQLSQIDKQGGPLLQAMIFMTEEKSGQVLVHMNPQL